MSKMSKPYNFVCDFYLRTVSMLALLKLISVIIYYRKYLPAVKRSIPAE